MTGSVARPRSGAMRGREMPTIVWLTAGAGVWLAAVGAPCALLTVAKCADAPAEDDRELRAPGSRKRHANHALDLVVPRVGVIPVAVRQPRLGASPITA